MTQDLHKSTQDLISNIERKDRRFRFFQALAIFLIFGALILIISAQQRTLEGVQQQLTEQKKIAQEAADHSDEQQATILRRLDCMTVFFSQRDRTSLTIENIDRCTLERDGNLQQFFRTNEAGETETTQEQQPTDPNLTPAPTQ